MKARNTIDEVLVIAQAVKDGKQIQYWYSQYGNFAESGYWQDCINSPVLNFADTIYRVKPVAKKVPLVQSDIPLDRPVWIENMRTFSLVMMVGIGWIRTWDGHYNFEELKSAGFNISFDGGKTWQKCEKEVAE